ncbi:MAG: hypothetical protein LJE74_00325 [Proteobacteria bacterium]|nr:hypothetical protein [Pseudomonadota bacterium]
MPDAPPAEETKGVYSLQVVWLFALPDPDHKLIMSPILIAFLVPPELSGGNTNAGGRFA